LSFYISFLQKEKRRNIDNKEEITMKTFIFCIHLKINILKILKIELKGFRIETEELDENG
jgi:hypothetical protein